MGEIYTNAPEDDAVMAILGGFAFYAGKPSEKLLRFKPESCKQDFIIMVPQNDKWAGLIEKWQAALRKRYGSADYNRLNENMRKTLVKVISLDLLPLLKSIQSPTLLIWGSADTATPLWMGQQMEKEIPDAGLVVFEGRSHFAFIEEWQRFLTIVKHFFWGGQAA